LACPFESPLGRQKQKTYTSKSTTDHHAQRARSLTEGNSHYEAASSFIANSIRALRESMGWSQEEFACAIHSSVNACTISRWERGHVTPLGACEK
jgi:DNA-binding transcriptional regulator YiaG